MQNPIPGARVFQPPTLSGLRVTNLPPWTTDETFYRDLVKLKILTDSKEQQNNISSFKVRGHKRFPEALGDCFLYFKNDEAAQDAMNKLIGHEISKGYILNCSQLVSKQDLQLKNSKNVCFERLKENVTLREFYEALIQKTDGILSLLIQQVNGYNYGFALFKSVEQAKIAANGITIQGKTYLGKETNPDKSTSKSKPLFTTDLIQGNNVLITFDKPLTDAEPSEYIKGITELFKDSIISSTFVWGKDARHMVHGASRIQELNPAISEIPRCELRADGSNLKPEFANQNQFNKNFYDCYRFENTTCAKLLQNQKKAYVSFSSKQQAIDFINKFHSSGSEFVLTVAGQQYVIEDCDPYNPVPSKQKTIRELKHKIKPSNVLFLKNLKNSINEETIKSIFKSQNYDISSIKIKSPETEVFLNDKKLEQQTKFATILVQDPKIAQDLVEKFKKDSSFRSKFQDIFEDYRYISMLQHKSQIKKTLKEKNPKRSQSARIGTQNNNQHISNFLPFPAFVPGLNPTMFLSNQFRNFRNNNFTGNMNRHHSANMHQQNHSAPNTNPNALANNTQNFRPQMNQLNQTRQPYYQNRFNERGYNNNQQNNSQGRQIKNRSYEANRGNKVNPKNQTGPRITPQTKPTAPSKAPVIAPKQPPAQKPLVQPAQPPTLPATQPAEKVPIVLADVEKLSKEEQKKFLGTHMYNKVIKVLAGEEKESAPKITGMLIDFEVFTLEEIVDLINDEEELGEQVKDALELIKENTQQTAN